MCPDCTKLQQLVREVLEICERDEVYPAERGRRLRSAIQPYRMCCIRWDVGDDGSLRCTRSSGARS